MMYSIKRSKGVWISLVVLTCLLCACSIRPRAQREPRDDDRVAISFGPNDVERDSSRDDELLVTPIEIAPVENHASDKEPKALEKVVIDEPAQSFDDAGKSSQNEIDVSALLSEPGKQYQTAKSSGSNSSRDYLINKNDVIAIHFMKSPEYDQTVTVRPDGKISLPFIGEVQGAGKSISQLSDELVVLFQEYLVEPEIVVMLESVGDHYCYVMGQVGKPGQYALTPGMTVLRAVAAAGGSDNGAKMNSIILIRNDYQSGAQVMRLNMDLGELQKNRSQDLVLAADDLIYVPKTFIANVDAFIERIYDWVLPPADLWVKYKYWYRRDW